MPDNRKQGFLNLPDTIESTPRASMQSPNAIERWLVRRLLSTLGNPAITVRFWDDSKISGRATATGLPTMTITDRGTLWHFLTKPTLYFGDAYSAGRIEVEGDLVRFLEAIYASFPSLYNSGPIARYATNRMLFRRRNTLSGSRHNIHHHYDLGNAFFRLWLDREMLYTCAYYPDPALTLEAAQLAKMEHVCRKLQLKPGETVVEAGCGWGSLARYMAREYGVKVHAYNISREQIKHARQRAQEEQLDDRIEYIEDDYRNIQGNYDVFVSVGMMEHVGKDNLQGFGHIIDRCLSPTGRGLIHSISQNEPWPMNPWLERRIFPGSYPPTLREMAAVLEPRNCVVVDVENLRLHYARTLEHWLERFDRHEEEIKSLYDPVFVRAWRLYLSASIANFTMNKLQLYQVLFTRSGVTGTPWVRAYPEVSKEI